MQLMKPITEDFKTVWGTRLVDPQCGTLEGQCKPKLCLVNRDGRDDGPAMTLGPLAENHSFRGISLMNDKYFGATIVEYCLYWPGPRLRASP